MKKAEYSQLKGAPSPRDSNDEEERKALISPEERHSDGAKRYDEEETEEIPPPRRSRRCLVFSGVFFSLLLLSIAIPYRRLFPDSDGGEGEGKTRLSLQTEGLLSNGTHEFKKTALIVSIDGLRCVSTLMSRRTGRSGSLMCATPSADYLDRNLTRHLLAISKDGLRAKSMKPIFPVCGFANPALRASLTRY